MNKRRSRQGAYTKYSFTAPEPSDPQPDTLKVLAPDPLVRVANRILRSADGAASVNQVCRQFITLSETFLAYKMWAQQALWERVRVTEFLRERYGVANDEDTLKELAKKLGAKTDGS